MTTPTITVTDWTGSDRTMTREEFQKVWTDELNQLWRLHTADPSEIETMKATVATWAGLSFDEQALRA